MKPVMCERGKSKRGVAVKTRSTVSGSARRSHSRKARRARREREREKESGAHWDIEHETERENERKNERISGSYKNGLMTRQHIRICMAVDGRQPNERGIDPELKEKKRSGHRAQQKKCKQRKQRRGIEQKKNKPFTKRTKGRRNVVNGARRQSDVALPAPWISFSPMIKIVFTYFPMRSLPFQTFLESIFTPTSRTAIIRSTGFFFQNSNYVWRWSVIISSDLVTDERW